MLTPAAMARAIATGWGGDEDRDAKAAREARELVKKNASPSLTKKLAAHGLDRTPRVMSVARLTRAAADLAGDPAVDGDALVDAFVETGSTGVALALASPKHAARLLASRVQKGELDLTLLDLTSLPDAIGELPGVTRIDLSQNRLHELPKAMQKLKLRGLHLANNGLHAIPETVFELRSLTALSLSDNAITHVPDRIGELGELRDLWLSDNPLHELPKGMLGLRKLRFLHLGELPWKEPPEWLAELPSLEELWLASSTLERLPPAICKMPKLRRLHLWYSKLSSVPEELFKCTKLVELRITNNPMPDETVARLRAALPRCTIY